MRTLTIISGICLLLAVSCVDEVIEKPVQLSDSADYNMKIIPENPTISEEIKLVIFNDCTYNVLSGVTRNGNKIDIQKQFNSMMKWPCIAQNDTILIGKLPEGIYTVNYKLLDTSTQVTDPVSISFTFILTVAKQ